MARYVDIDEVKQAWAEQAPMTYQLIKDDLDKFLTADVRENIHGMWIIDEDGNIECSVCGHHGVGDLYCERCGARMDEEELETTEEDWHKDEWRDEWDERRENGD